MVFCFHPSICYVRLAKLHHAAHTWSTAHWHCRLLLRLVNNQAFGCQEHTCDAGCVLKCNTSNLGRIDDTSLTQILVYIGTSVVTEVALTLTNFLNDYGTLATSIGNNLAQRLLNGTTDDVHTCLLVGIVALYILQGLLSADVGSTTTCYNTFLDGSTGSAKSIVNTILLLLHLNLRVSTYVEYCYATSQLSQTLLQFLLIV